MNDDISLGELIVVSLKFIRKYIILLATLAILGGIGGYVIDKNKNTVYRSNMILCSDLVNHQLLNKMLKDVVLATEQGNAEFLSTALKLDKSICSLISEVVIKQIDNEHKYDTKSDLSRNRFEECIVITCKVLDPKVLPDIEKAISRLINSNQHLSSIVEIRRKSYTENRILVQGDVELLRKEREMIYQNLKNGNSNIDIIQFDAQEDFIKGYDKIAEYNELLSRSLPSVVVKSFSEGALPINSTRTQIIKFLALGLFAGLLIALFKEIKL